LNGYQRDSICISRSVAKSFTSALVGIAIDEGFIKSVDDPIINYLPELKDRGFDAITIRNLLTMGSGIRYRISPLPWDEDALYYFYPDLRNLLLTDMAVAEPPGNAFHYTDYNVGLLAIIVERTTHRTVSEYLQEKIWKPIGMEYPATWSLDSVQDGLELTHVALNARAIDYAKFGQLYLDKGNWNGRQIISERWVAESTAPDPNDHRPWETYPQWADAGGYYKYFWWGNSIGTNDYSFEAIGRWGQFIFVAPRANVVIVRTAGDFGLGLEQWPQVFQYIANFVSRRNLRSPRRESVIDLGAGSAVAGGLLRKHAIALLLLLAAFEQRFDVARDQPRAAIVADVGPRPFDDHDEPVAKSDQKENVHEQPHQPCDESAEMQPRDVGDRGRLANRRERSLVAVAERRRWLAANRSHDVLRRMPAFLHRGR